ncbi:ABC transporter permease [Roseibium sp. AS2]|uniref:ABC transporter permease n=1 Tax=Roseibium sp. AS2 TaxID=3135781 RepID=UPI003179570E
MYLSANAAGIIVVHAGPGQPDPVGATERGLPRMISFLTSLIRSLLGIALAVGVWAAIVVVFDTQHYILPGPVRVFEAFAGNAGFLLSHAGITAYETVLGFVLGAAAGAALSVLLWLFPAAARLAMPPILVTQALPVFAIAPILVLWLGFGLASKIVVVILVIFFTVTSTFFDGLQRLDQGLCDLARLYRLSRLRELWLFRLPAGLPAFASGLRVAAVFAPMGAIIGEWAGAKGGLAFIMLQSSNRMQADLMFAALILLAAMVLIMRFAVNRLTQFLVPWQPVS